MRPLFLGLQTLWMIYFTKIFQLKGLKPKKNSRTNFYECCHLTKKVYLPFIEPKYVHSAMRRGRSVSVYSSVQSLGVTIIANSHHWFCLWLLEEPPTIFVSNSIMAVLLCNDHAKSLFFFLLYSHCTKYL